MDKNNNFDELEKELQNYKEMSTSINNIKTNASHYEREPFKDINKVESCSLARSEPRLNEVDRTLNKQNFSVDNFVKDLEINLDNFDNIQNDQGPLPSNLSFTNEKPKKKTIEHLENIVVEKKVEIPSRNWKELIYNFLIEIKEPVIIIIIFILVNNPDFIRVVAKIPYLNRIISTYPSLIIRGSIVALIIYLLRKNNKNE